MNILYTLFDFSVGVGRFIGICLLSIFALGLLAFILLEIFLFLSFGVGGFAFMKIMENPPDFINEMLGK